jgi:ubiquinone/menaquinone biosynthesis C-methylase UbiE
MNNIVAFYEAYDEEGRLDRHPVEFLVTTYLLDAVIVPGASILDVAGGTGKYAAYYALKSHPVTILDLSPKHVEQARAKLSQMGLDHVETLIGDARDLSRFANECFGVVLCMGPIYHLSDKDARAVIAECLRVLRPDGLLAMAYVNKYPDWEAGKYAEHFVHRSAEEMEQIIGEFPVGLDCHAPTDGPVYEELAALLSDCGEDTVKSSAWLEQNCSIIEDSMGLDTCIHGLLIGKKIA